MFARMSCIIGIGQGGPFGAFSWFLLSRTLTPTSRQPSLVTANPRRLTANHHQVTDDRRGRSPPKALWSQPLDARLDVLDSGQPH